MRATVLIAHYNLHEFLEKAITSAKNQTYPCHICVIDDGSDSVEGLINGALFDFNPPDGFDEHDNLSIQDKDNKTVIYIKDGPKGPSYARNRGIEYLWDNTDIFIVLDADDEMYPTKVEECVRTISQAPSEIGAVYADTDILNTTTGKIQREYREPFSLPRLRQECIVHSGAAINKMALEIVKEDTGYYDENLRTVEDYDLWLRISEKFMIVHIPKSLTLVRVQPKNSTDTVAKEIWNKNYQRVIQKTQARNV